MRLFLPKFIIVLLLLMPAGPLLAAPETLHHDLKVSLVPGQQMLEGTDRIRVRTGGTTRLAFDLAPNAEVLGVKVGAKESSWSFSRGQLAVRLPARSEEAEVTISYRARFADEAPSAPIITEDPSYGVAGTIGPQGAFLGGGARWYPELRGSSPTFRIEVETPDEMSAVSDGQLVLQEAGRTIWESDRPIRGLALAAGPFEINERRVGDIPVYTFFYPQSRDLVDTYLEATSDYITLYEELFGPYPFEKFAVVENFFPTGYGFPSWTLLGSTIIRLPFIIETSLGHEVAHSWWGNGVRVDLREGNWSEGLTTYVADYLYKERQSEQEGREYRLQILRDYATLVSPGDEMALERFTHRTTAAERAIGYGKAAMVFHMARRTVGDEAFWGGLRRLASQRMFDYVTWDDIAAALGETAGIDLKDFFSQWVQRSGAPVLSLENVRQVREGDQWKISGVLRQRPPAYDLRVPLRLETGNKGIEKIFVSSAPVVPFEIVTDAPVRRLVVDPEADLFRRLDNSEIPPTVNGIRGSTSLLVVAADNLSEETLGAARLLTTALGKPETEVRRESEISARDLRRRDVLYIGLPTSEGLLPPLPENLELSPGRVVLNDRIYDDARSALFIALDHPSEPGRTSALYLPGSPDAAADAARRIPHYGKYSYLAFIEGENVDKGVWPVTESPLIHHFTSER
jgi:hypothetical protein